MEPGDVDREGVSHKRKKGKEKEGRLLADENQRGGEVFLGRRRMTQLGRSIPPCAFVSRARPKKKKAL